MRCARVATVWAVLLLGIAEARGAPDADPPACRDPVYLQYLARIADRPDVESKIAGWEEFLQTFPRNACADEARGRLRALEGSRAAVAAAEQDDGWRQEARGGLIEPGRDELASHMIFPDAPGRTRFRLLSEIVWLQDWPAFKAGLTEVVWTQVLRAEYGPLKWLAMNVDLPLAAGALDDEGFAWALGNMTFGLRGIWGTRLDAHTSWVISGGYTWSPGSSAWSGSAHKPLLDATAFGAAHVYHLFRYDAPDHILHAETQLGLGAHFFGLALIYHLFAGGGQVEKILRIDGVWDWRFAEHLSCGLGLNGAVGVGEQGVGETSNGWYGFVFVSPTLRVHYGYLVAGFALRVPLPEASDWSRLVIGVEVGVEL